ncbi:unnamed protein product [Gordionus sp. m RMFG-2023]
MSSSDSESEKSDTNETREEGSAKPNLKHVASTRSEEEDKISGQGEKTEAQIAMEAQRKKHLEQEEQWLSEYQEMRTQEREREQEELVKLKERQAERRKERVEEDKILAEKRRVMEEKRKEEEEEIRKKREEEKQRRQAESEKRRAELQNIMGGYIGVAPQPNFVIEKREKVTPIAKDKSPEEMAKEKEETVQRRLKALNLSGLGGQALKERARELHRKILKLETERYESEDRIKRQEYDLKELTERQRLMQKQKMMKLGIDPTSDEAKFPPKVQVASKYERRTDRRSYNDRRYLFEDGVPDKEVRKEQFKKNDILDDYI